MNIPTRRPRKFKIIRRDVVPPNPAITFTLEETISNPNIPALTRYLYIHTDVEHTIRHCFSNPHRTCIDELLFWAYELYFSGYVVETIEILSSIYNASISDSRLSSRLQSQIASLMDDESKHECIANMVHNIYTRIRNATRPPLWVSYKKHQIHRYCHRFITPELPAAEFLNTVCRYRVEPSATNLYDKIIDESNWVYFANFAPLWRKRIQLFRKTVIIDDDAETIRFKTDGFRNAFGYLKSEWKMGK